MSASVACDAMQSRHRLLSTPAARERESNAGIGLFTFAHPSCDLKSDSCISQNLPWTEAHIAASEAATAFGCSDGIGRFRNARRIFPVCTNSLSIAWYVSSCQRLQNGH